MEKRSENFQTFFLEVFFLLDRKNLQFAPILLLHAKSCQFRKYKLTLADLLSLPLQRFYVLKRIIVFKIFLVVPLIFEQIIVHCTLTSNQLYDEQFSPSIFKASWNRSFGSLSDAQLYILSK